jgi:hypothetical protein
LPPQRRYAKKAATVEPLPREALALLKAFAFGELLSLPPQRK